MDVRIRFQPSGARVVAAAGTSLMAAVQRAGLPLAGACGADGLCGRCGLRVTAGAELLSPETSQETHAKHRNRIDASLRLACCAVVSGAAPGDVDVTAAYW